MTNEEAFDALNELRSNIIGTQSASWFNVVYPLVAILNAVGYEQFDSTPVQLNEHLDCYGGAGGYPGNLRREPNSPWVKPFSKLQHLTRRVKIFLDDPTDKNRDVLVALVRDEEND